MLATWTQYDVILLTDHIIKSNHYECGFDCGYYANRYSKLIIKITGAVTGYCAKIVE